MLQPTTTMEYDGHCRYFSSARGSRTGATKERIVYEAENATKSVWGLAGQRGMWVPGPHPPPPPTMVPPGPGRPCSPAVPHNRNEPPQTRGGRTMENDPSQCFFTGAENRIRAGTGAPFARRKERHHILYGNQHVTMTLLLTSGSNHTIPL